MGPVLFASRVRAMHPVSRFVCSSLTKRCTTSRLHSSYADSDVSLFGEPTLFHSFQRSVKMYPELPCLGCIENLTGNRSFVFRSYKDVGVSVRDFAAGMIAAKIVDTNSEGLKTLGICMKNRPEWVVAEQACYW
jgi:long-subunit acyl-CoA synthetase (AMP-forming)